jgi:DNA polymerase
VDFPGAEEFIPRDARTLEALARAVQGCRGCDLYEFATQAVFGEGPPGANVMVVGEQPGDVEDREGVPFVGPAGRLLDKALQEAGFRREDLYVTNAVKHFKFHRETRGKRRIHQTPTRAEVVACRPWMVAEIAKLKPALVVVLGSTAAQSLLGPSFRVTRERGQPQPWQGISVLPTVHPSSVLRSDDRKRAYADLVADLRVGAELFKSSGGRVPAHP